MMGNSEIKDILGSVEMPPEKGHYETVKEYTKEQPVYDENGVQTGTQTVVTGRERKWVWTDEEETKKELRRQREAECFPIINRGQLWYDTLIEAQRSELNDWYHAWLNVTATLIVPNKLEWLKI